MGKNPVTLVFALSSKAKYRPVLYSDNEIFCSPQEIPRFEEGRPVTLNTPQGEFDIKGILQQLPSGCRVELVVAKVDATLACVPRGLAALDCPKVLVIGAPHQFSWPLTNLLKYQKTERFDVIVSDHDRHHLHWFKRFGCQRTHWIPGLNFCLRERPVAAPSENRAIFVGQTGRFHPYRSSLFKSLERRGIPMTIRTAKPEDTADLYASHAISLNGSLNGDLNLRVFEVLGSGGLLLTDRLSFDSGLEMLFEDGKDLVLYSGRDDLANKIRHYLSHPDEALQIRRRGQARLLEEHRPELKRRQLMDLVFQGQECQQFALEDDRFRALASRPLETLFKEVAIYELLQELHISAERIVIYSDSRSLPYCEDLPRLEYRPLQCCSEDIDTELTSGLAEWRFLVIDNADREKWEPIVERFVGDRVIVPPEIQGTETLTAMLGEYGYIEVDGRSGVFEQSAPLLSAARFAAVKATEAARVELEKVDTSRLDGKLLLSLAQIAQSCGDWESCAAALELALASDRSLIDVYLALAAIRSEQGEKTVARTLLNEARRLAGSLPQESEALLERLSSDPVTFNEGYREYERRVGLAPSSRKLPTKSRILIYTNLFPPQELGGYGRKMWEFAYELSLRGHEIKVLAGDADYLWKEPSADEAVLEPYVERCLELSTEWRGGQIEKKTDAKGARQIMYRNAERVLAVVDDWEPDFCLLGNIEIIGYQVIEQLALRELPMVHCLGNAHTGCPDNFEPENGLYVLGPASRYLGEHLEAKGVVHARWEVLYPGARIDLFYRDILPRCDIPRIAFAGLLMQYKGAHTLIDALALLKKGGIEFRATIAGDSTDNEYVAGLRRKADLEGLSDWVDFPGFLGRKALAQVFDRSNIMVFPSVFEEPFGISQVEALASGLVLITSGQGGSREIVRDAQDGLVFKVEDARDLAMKIAGLVANPNEWKRLSIAGRERALDFAIPKTVDRIEELFGEMLAKLKGV